MSEYRLYYLDRDGHIQRAVELECAGDEQAIRFAREHLDQQGLELWQRDRVVAKFSPALAGAA